MTMSWEAIGLLATTAAFCGAAGVFPLLNTEAYLLAMAMHPGRPSIWVLAFVAAGAQMAGKLVLYAAGRGWIPTPKWRRARAGPGKWTARVEGWRTWTGRHAWGLAAVTLASATAGMPPFAIWAIVAGTLRTHWTMFLCCGMAGRYMRFIGLLAAAGLVRHALG